MGKRYEETFHLSEHADDKQDIKRCSTALPLGKCKLKPQSDCLSHPPAWLKWEKLGRILNAGEYSEKLDPSPIAGGDVKQYSHPGKHFGSFLKKNQNPVISIWLSNCTHGYLSQRNKNTKACIQMLIADLFVIAPKWKQPRCPSTG